ncbi:MAG: hypothetical protein U0168_05660 [Nannocystaceae bacterium]
MPDSLCPPPRAPRRPPLRALALALGAAGLAACHGIDIEQAVYAGNCGHAVDVTDRVAESCDDDGCRCDSACFAPSTDPAPGCAKDLRVTFRHRREGSETITCGPAQNDNFVFEVSADGDASCEMGSNCIANGNACGPANNPNGSCCSGFCDANGVCGL